MSVIIPTYLREAPLRRMLGSLLSTELGSAEILLMDQTSSHKPETHAFLEACEDRMTRIELSHASVTAACNVGARFARGTLLLFLDDDIEVACSDLLSRHQRAFADPSVGAVVGRIMNSGREQHRPPPKIPMAPLGFLDLHFDHDIPMDYPTLAGANMSVRKEVWERLGGFDERYTGEAFRWETDFSFRLRQAGWRIRFEPAARVIHYYGTPGGCGNENLLGRNPKSHEYYRSFFRNNYLFAATHFGDLLRLRVLWKVYREHVLNGAYLREGPMFLWRRHMALWHGARMARGLLAVG